MVMGDGRWFGPAADGRLFSVFGQSGVARWFASGLAPVPLPVIVLFVGTG